MTIDTDERTAPTAGAVVDAAVDAAAVAEQVSACRSVAGLHGGRDGSIHTDTASGRVTGVRIDRSTLVVGVVGQPETDTVRTVSEVRSAIRCCPPDLSICVSVEARSDP